MILSFGSFMLGLLPKFGICIHNVFIFSLLGSQTYYYSCDQNTVKTCERSVCECDAQFMNALTQLLFENPALNPWSHNKNFNYDKEKCEKKSINKRSGPDFQVSLDYITKNQTLKFQFFCHFRLQILVLWIRC